MSKRSKQNADEPTEWTAMHEAIAFVSATLGEAFTTAQGNGLYWSAFAALQEDGLRGYPCAVEHVAPGKVRVVVSFSAAKLRATPHLYAIIGWATYHGHAVEWD
jgi:hypothetical protein